MVAMVEQPQWIGLGYNGTPDVTIITTDVRSGSQDGLWNACPIARRSESKKSNPQRMPGQNYRAPFRPGRDYSKVKCFSCGQMGHTQARRPKPASLSTGWVEFPARGPTTSPWRTTTGKWHIDRELTHTGLHTIHLDPSSHQLILRNHFTHPPEILFSLWFRI